MELLILKPVLILFYFICAHFIVEYTVKRIWLYIKEEWKPNKLTATLGNIDRVIYAILSIFNQYYLIFIYLSIKVIARITVHSSITKDEQIKEIGEKKNAFLIGNIFSLLLGIIGGLLIKFLYYLK